MILILMFKALLALFSLILRCLPKLFSDQALTIIVLQKQLEVLSRSMSPAQKRKLISPSDRFVLAFVSKLLGKLKDTPSLVSPKTLLAWQSQFIASRWSFPSFSHPGRPVTPEHIKNLVRRMKNQNPFWGAGKIKGELLKLDISLDKKTIATILRSLRHDGKLMPAYSWSSFLKAQAASLFATDFLTVDTLFGHRLYVFFIIALASRRIVRCSITSHPTHEFVRQQIIQFSEDVPGKKYLIHDNGPELCALDYSAYGIEGVCTSVKSPNMNAFAERFVRSIRSECLDWFLLVSDSQVSRLVRRYVDYYNSLRPHQGIGQNVPEGYTPQTSGPIRASPILGGLHHHYHRSAA